LCFDFPLIEVEKVFFLELFHGPTMAFKDVGARFMSRCLGYFNKDIKDSKIRFLLLLRAIQAALLQAVSLA
jgi:threonine synthase